MKIFEHASNFANHLVNKTSVIHEVLRTYESYEVITDEINRSVDTLVNLHKLSSYYQEEMGVNKIASFLPLNLPLYSYILFAVMPSHQAKSTIVRPPERMFDVFFELATQLEFSKYYPDITLYEGCRNDFVTKHCAESSVVLFTGKYINFLKIQKRCSKGTLFLYNGVGHNPIVVTPSADIDLAVKKTIYVKLFNNGQDCAGPDCILVHDLIIDEFLEKLHIALDEIPVSTSYSDDTTKIGPLFEIDSLLDAAKFTIKTQDNGAEIVYGGRTDLKHGLMHPLVLKAPLSIMNNFMELYSPIFFISHYANDSELNLYFNDVHNSYQNRQMYVSLFGESNVVQNALGSIILKNKTIHDVERGIEEYGGYSPEASSVSYRGVNIHKPLLIPREINNFLFNKESVEMFSSFSKISSKQIPQLIANQFQKTVTRIFDKNLIFAFIFGSFAINRGKRFSDIDTLICVDKKENQQMELYLDWLFQIHELFGRIIDFKYPAEIVTFSELESSSDYFQNMTLSVQENGMKCYDAMVWFHALAQNNIGTVFPENIPSQWQEYFPDHSLRLLSSFLHSLDIAIKNGEITSLQYQQLNEIPRNEPELSRYLSNLNKRGLVEILKMVPFTDEPQHTNAMLQLVSDHPFMGKSLFDTKSSNDLYNPYFRFGVVS